MKREIKKHTIVNTREFMRDFSRITERPRYREYTVIRYGKPIGTYTPHSAPGKSLKKKCMTLDDLESFRFRSGIKKLSTRIDRIVYGT